MTDARCSILGCRRTAKLSQEMHHFYRCTSDLRKAFINSSLPLDLNLATQVVISNQRLQPDELIFARQESSELRAANNKLDIPAFRDFPCKRNHLKTGTMGSLPLVRWQLLVYTAAALH